MADFENSVVAFGKSGAMHSFSSVEQCSTSGRAAQTAFHRLPPSSRVLWHGRDSRLPPLHAWNPFGGRDQRGGSGGPTTNQYDAEAMRRRGGYDYPPPPSSGAPGGPPGGETPPPAPPSGNGGLSSYAQALIAAAFVTGLGAGVYFDAEINLSPNQVGFGFGLRPAGRLVSGLGSVF